MVGLHGDGAGRDSSPAPSHVADVDDAEPRVRAPRPTEDHPLADLGLLDLDVGVGLLLVLQGDGLLDLRAGGQCRDDADLPTVLQDEGGQRSERLEGVLAVLAFGTFTVVKYRKRFWPFFVQGRRGHRALGALDCGGDSFARRDELVVEVVELVKRLGHLLVGVGTIDIGVEGHGQLGLVDVVPDVAQDGLLQAILGAGHDQRRTLLVSGERGDELQRRRDERLVEIVISWHDLDDGVLRVDLR